MVAHHHAAQSAFLLPLTIDFSLPIEKDPTMPKYVIEREIPGIGNVSAEEAAGIAQQSCRVLTDMGPQIQWLHSYVVENKTYCVYIAPSEEEVRRHAETAGFPANSILEVKAVIDPVTAEG
jgi:hypothetical protein